MKNIFLLGLGIVVSSVTYSASETETSEALRLCKEVSLKAYGETMDKDTIKMTCKEEPRNSSHWKCVKEKLESGESPNYAFSECKRLRP